MPDSTAASGAKRIRRDWGWTKIAALERLGPHLGAALAARSLGRAAAEARRTVKPLKHWERIPENSYTTYQADGNVVRIKRILDLLQPADRVLDIGIGFGYVTGVLLRDSRVAYYCGTDIKEWMLNSAREAVAVNGAGQTSHRFELMNVYDIDAEFARRHDPSVVLLLEVLEHVEDPTRALRRIADLIRPRSRVVFTVPILGRLEGVWGHRWVFGVGGIQ
jgi:2-polyprenyl-3-methyl-5-hydroxy-6-metoxy-1,4-benzoquinol methylase